MLSSHGSNKEQIDAVSDFLKSSACSTNVSLSEELMELAAFTAGEVVKIVVQEDRKEFIRDVFNEHDTGYGEHVRIAFENEVMRKANYAKPNEGSPESASREFITESVKQDRAAAHHGKGMATAYKGAQTTNRVLDGEKVPHYKRKLKSSNNKAIKHLTKAANVFPNAIRPTPVKKKIASSYEEILPLLEDISDQDFLELTETLSEDNCVEVSSVLFEDYDLALEDLANDLEELDEQTTDAVIDSLTEEELESVIDAYEYMCEQTEVLEEGIGSDARAAAAATYKDKRSHSEMGARYKGRNSVRKIGAFALKAARKYASAKKAAGAPIRAAGAGLSAAKSYVDSVRKGATNAATNAARRGKDNVRKTYAAGKSGVSGLIKKGWNGIKSVGKKIKHAAKYAIGKASNFLSKQGKYANKVDSLKNRKTRNANRPSKSSPMSRVRAGKKMITVSTPSLVAKAPRTASAPTPAAKTKKPKKIGEASLDGKKLPTSSTPGKAEIMSKSQQSSASERLAAIAARNAAKYGDGPVRSQSELISAKKKDAKKENTPNQEKK